MCVDGMGIVSRMVYGMKTSAWVSEGTVMQNHGHERYVGRRVDVTVRASKRDGGQLLDVVTGRVARYHAASGAILVLSEEREVDRAGDDVSIVGSDAGWRWFVVGSDVDVEAEDGSVWEGCSVSVRANMEVPCQMTFSRIDAGVRLAVELQSPRTTRYGTVRAVRRREQPRVGEDGEPELDDDGNVIVQKQCMVEVLYDARPMDGLREELDVHTREQLVRSQVSFFRHLPLFVPVLSRRRHPRC